MTVQSALFRLRVWVWGEYKATEKEERLLRKIDVGILTFACISYFVARLDNSNLANAYVSGMKEDLNMSTEAYSQMTSIYQAGYSVGQVPCNLAILYFPPRYYMSFLLFMLAVFSLSCAFVQNVQSVSALRFLVGFAESGMFCSVNYILGSWYGPNELARRAAIYTGSGFVGSIISGVIQDAINHSLNGTLGRPGWRWLFIIDAILTFPIALLGVLTFPDTPTKTKAFYLNEEERELARTRLPPRDKVVWSRSAVIGAFKSWQLYVFTIFFTNFGLMETFNFNSLAPLWFKSYPESFSLSNANQYPNGVYAVAIVAVAIMSAVSDNTRNRWAPSVVIGLACIVFSIIFLIYPEDNKPALMAAIYVHGIVFAGQSINYTWANEATKFNPILRTITLAVMNLAAYIFLIWYGIVVVNSAYAPRFYKCAVGTLVLSILSFFFLPLIMYLTKRDPNLQEDGAQSDSELDTEKDAEKDSKGSETNVTVHPVL
ncbi:major facilitator superfamily domain-containing protein [Schizophyllum amplum]|uniref:Major facilitator superfamily domain-containing protein n=1 Tax=Schizophyllum amplum TaxID=97359 RepID=A0A550CPX6_9AGAR|nr:major facilitator superfamily domain-containing protein [Auriculariopsis ampla]